MTGKPESQDEMKSLLGRRIVLGITGSIAAYKSAFLARELTRRGACKQEQGISSRYWMLLKREYILY